MATTEQELDYFKLIPHIPTDSLGRKVLKLSYQQKLQTCHMKGISIFQLEEELAHLEKIGFWKREDNETYVINHEYYKLDFHNLGRLERDANRK